MSYEIYDLSGEQINRVSYLPYEPAGEKKDISVVDNKVIATFTAQAKSEKMYLYKGLAGMTDPTKDFVIKNAMLVEGNKAGDYAEAPEQSDTRLNVIASYFNTHTRHDKRFNLYVRRKR